MHSKYFLLSSLLLGASAAPSKQLGRREVGQSDKQLILKLHNDERATIGSPPLQWSDSLASSAQQYSDTCVGLVHAVKDPNGVQFGENIAQVGGLPADQRITWFVNQWLAERKDFNYDRPGLQAAHWTMAVWAGSTAVGCGLSDCANLRPYNWVFVCRYLPQGNWITSATTWQENIGRPIDGSKGVAMQSASGGMQQSMGGGQDGRGGQSGSDDGDGRDGQSEQQGQQQPDNNNQQDDDPNQSGAGGQNQGAAGQGGGGGSGISPQDKERILSLHNNERAKYGSPALQWDDQLAAGAQRFTERCTGGGSGESGYTETVALEYGSAPQDRINTLIGFWLAERPKYNYNNPGFTAYGWTAMVWKSTMRIGCGLANCPKDGQNLWQLNCRYVPGGNYITSSTSWRDNVPRPL